MIEIIKQPELMQRENKKYQITCNHCGCVFTCMTEDWRHNVIVGHGERDDVISCPVCHKNFYLSCIFTLGEGVEIEG